MKLYKYVPADRIQNLVSGRIRFTQPAALNDLLEMKPVFKRWMSDEDYQSKAIEPTQAISRDKLIDRFLEEVWDTFPIENRRVVSIEQSKHNLKQAYKTDPYLHEQFEKWYERAINQAAEDFRRGEHRLVAAIPDGFNATYGVLSMTTKANNAPMWSHYTGDHRGFVIEFDASHAFFTTYGPEESDLTGLHKITYQVERPSAEAFLSDSNNWKDFYLVKDEDWRYEDEWRMVRLLDKAAEIKPHSGC